MTGSIASSAYRYDLPERQIAQRPVYPADAARLLVVDREKERLAESTFSSILDFVKPDDLLIFNNSKVIPARLIGRRETGGRAQLFLTREIAPNCWQCTGKPLKKMLPGSVITFTEVLTAEVKSRDEIFVTVEFFAKGQEDPERIRDLILEVGMMPIPPYIRDGEADEKDRTDYQPLLAEHEGSVAAPTASLHFTSDLLEQIRQHCQIRTVTLHVGAPSFTPLWREGQEQEVQLPGKEYFFFDSEIARSIQHTREKGGRVIAVGTTAVRALESMAATDPATARHGMELSTELFISPGFKFKYVDGMITNFHMPRSTHLLLVQAFIGGALLESSYRYALDENFRFLSYGDGMLLL